MNLFELVLTQMRQRALGTWLTLLSVTFGVALAIAILVLYREAGGLFGQTDYGFDVLIGRKGSSTQLVMNTVYQLDQSPGNLPYLFYEDLLHKREYRQYVKLAVPYVVGDSYQGKYRIVGTTPDLFGYGADGQRLPIEKVMGYRLNAAGEDQRYELAEGRDFKPDRFEAVIGSDVAKQTDLKVGTTFRATHGTPQGAQPQETHKTVWTVVGVLAPTHTASDRVVFLPYESLYTIGTHQVGMTAHMYIRQGKAPPPSTVDPETLVDYTQDPDGTFHLTSAMPPQAREVSAILVKARSAFAADSLMYVVNNGDLAQAVNPAATMRQFFDSFLKSPTYVLLVIAVLVTVGAALGILVSIYNSVSARLREIAILRALGATRVHVLSMICVESMLVGLAGGLAGLVVGHAVAGVASLYFTQYVGEGIRWEHIGSVEWLYVAGVVVVSLLAGLVPATKAYRTPVATNLVVV